MLGGERREREVEGEVGVGRGVKGVRADGGTLILCAGNQRRLHPRSCLQDDPSTTPPFMAYHFSAPLVRRAVSAVMNTKHPASMLPDFARHTGLYGDVASPPCTARCCPCHCTSDTACPWAPLGSLFPAPCSPLLAKPRQSRLTPRGVDWDQHKHCPIWNTLHNTVASRQMLNPRITVYMRLFHSGGESEKPESRAVRGSSALDADDGRSQVNEGTCMTTSCSPGMISGLCLSVHRTGDPTAAIMVQERHKDIKDPAQNLTQRCEERSQPSRRLV